VVAASVGGDHKVLRERIASELGVGLRARRLVVRLAASVGRAA